MPVSSSYDPREDSVGPLLYTVATVNLCVSRHIRVNDTSIEISAVFTEDKDNIKKRKPEALREEYRHNSSEEYNKESATEDLKN